MLTIEQRLAIVEKKLNELATNQAKLHSDIQLKVEDLNAAAIRIVETMLATSLGTIQTNVNEIKADVALMKNTNDRQLELLEEAATERGRRVQREQEYDMRQKELALRSKSVQVDSEDADVEQKKAETKIRKWKVAAAIIIPLVTTIGGLIGAAIGSH
jgi:hypothetical protein